MVRRVRQFQQVELVRLVRPFAIAALILSCASSISGVSLTPIGLARGETLASWGAGHGLPAVDAAPPATSKASVRVSARRLPTTPHLRPAVAGLLARFADRHTLLSQEDLVSVATTILEEAERHRLDPSLVMAVIEVESGYYNLAVSHVGALGLMQLMPATGRELAHKHGVAWSGEESLFDPVVNVKLGTAYLGQLADRYDGDVGLALAAYNWGPARIDGFLRRGLPLPTEYVRRVMQSYTPARRSS